MRLALAGTAMGVVLSLGVSRLFASQLEGINTFDRLAYLGGVGAVLGAAVAASYFPGRRAARIEPIHTLRHD